MKNWIQSYTGRQVTPLTITPDQICLEDIAHALSNKSRYTGHCPRFYSVAEHSVKGARLFAQQGRPDLALAFLFHDAAEAYLPDIAGPIKGFFRVEHPEPFHEPLTFDELEGYVLRQVARALALTDAASFDDPAIRTMDLNVLLAERDALFPQQPEDWKVPGTPAPVKIENWAPAKAESEFLNTFMVLRDPRPPMPAKAKRGRK